MSMYLLLAKTNKYILFAKTNQIELADRFYLFKEGAKSHKCTNRQLIEVRKDRSVTYFVRHVLRIWNAIYACAKKLRWVVLYALKYSDAITLIYSEILFFFVSFSWQMVLKMLSSSASCSSSKGWKLSFRSSRAVGCLHFLWKVPELSLFTILTFFPK